MDDGLIEVIGLTTNTLPKLLAGGKGICIGQCRSAVIRTRRTIPMQVDGEASRLNPATIELSLLNQVGMHDIYMVYMTGFHSVISKSKSIQPCHQTEWALGTLCRLQRNINGKWQSCGAVQS